MSNKKATSLVLEVIIVLIIASLIFMPACSLGSKLFRLSTQANENFIELAKEIKLMAAREEDKTDSFLLIMDKGTVIVGFNAEKEQFSSCVKVGTEEFCADWERPKVKECQDKSSSCVCLIKELVFKTEPVRIHSPESTTRKPDIVYFNILKGKIELKSANCEKIEKATFKMPDKTGKSYKEGFIFIRYENDYLMSDILKDRRNTVYLRKEGKVISVCLDKNCGKIDETDEWGKGF